MEGRGLTGEAKVILTVTDSNDNPPAFVQSNVSTRLVAGSVPFSSLTCSS